MCFPITFLNNQTFTVLPLLGFHLASTTSSPSQHLHNPNPHIQKPILHLLHPLLFTFQPNHIINHNPITFISRPHLHCFSNRTTFTAHQTPNQAFFSHLRPLKFPSQTTDPSTPLLLPSISSTERSTIRTNLNLPKLTPSHPKPHLPFSFHHINRTFIHLRPSRLSNLQPKASHPFSSFHHQIEPSLRFSISSSSSPRFHSFLSPSSTIDSSPSPSELDQTQKEKRRLEGENPKPEATSPALDSSLSLRHFSSDSPSSILVLLFLPPPLPLISYPLTSYPDLVLMKQNTKSGSGQTNPTLSGSIQYHLTRILQLSQVR